MNATEIQQAMAANPEMAKEAEGRMQALLVRSATDMEFRARLLSDPRAAIAEFTGHELPANYRVKFVENKGDATLVLPDFVNEGELSENELEAVAGGTAYALFITVAIGAVMLQGWNDGQEHR
ncbi:MAG TPA: NHLP leader peptide family RiPP precursor [Longimicrobium sp.]|nr:NHLP leader peptide family RiPP precursor [Longimicrobium sp.]